MNRVWIGRRLVQAAPALRDRLLEEGRGAGAGLDCLAPIAGELLRQAGVFLILGEEDYRRPFARTRGVLRFDAELRPAQLAIAYNVLMAITAQYLDNLPGVTAREQKQVRRALHHAAVQSLELLRSLRAGVLSGNTSGFGGAPILAFRSRKQEGAESAPVPAA